MEEIRIYKNHNTHWLPALQTETEFKYSLVLEVDVTVNLEAIAGYLRIAEGTTINAPNLKEVGGDVILETGAKFIAPLLTKCAGVHLEGPNIILSARLLLRSKAIYLKTGATCLCTDQIN